MKSVFWLLLAFISATSFAKSATPLSDLVAESIAKEYLAERSQKIRSSNYDGLLHKISSIYHDPNCRDDRDPGGCVDAACARMDSYDCDDMDEIKEIAKSCAGNRGGACLEATCARMDSYDCDDMDELKEVAESCRGSWDGKCLNEVCSRMDSYDCDDMHELTAVSKACRGVDASCIDSVCSRMDSYDCDDLHELVEVAKSCGGR